MPGEDARRSTSYDALAQTASVLFFRRFRIGELMSISRRGFLGSAIAASLATSLNAQEAQRDPQKKKEESSHSGGCIGELMSISRRGFLGSAIAASLATSLNAQEAQRDPQKKKEESSHSGGSFG